MHRIFILAIACALLTGCAGIGGTGMQNNPIPEDFDSSFAF